MSLKKRKPEHDEERTAKRIQTAQPCLDLGGGKFGLPFRNVDIEYGLDDAVLLVCALHVLGGLQDRVPGHTVSVGGLLLPLGDEDVLTHGLSWNNLLDEAERLVQPCKRSQKLRAPVPRLDRQQKVLVPECLLHAHPLQRRDYRREFPNVFRKLLAVLDRDFPADVLDHRLRIGFWRASVVFSALISDLARISPSRWR